MKGRIPLVDPADILDGIDSVIHLAASLPDAARGERSAYELVNTRWTEALGTACALRGVTLIFPSTGSVYAGEHGELLSEDTPYIRPQEPYAVSKYKAEQALQSLKKKGLRFSIVRMGSVFGPAPQVNPHTVVNSFVLQALRREPLTVWQSALDQMRPYTYVGDAVAAINFLIDQDVFEGDVYNVVSENTTVRTVTKEIQKHVPDHRVTIVESGRMNDFSFGMDDGKIRALGFKARGTLHDGISELFRALAPTPLV